MRIESECIPCIIRQVLQALRFRGVNRETEERVLKKTLMALAEMPWDRSPMDMATTIHGMVRREMPRHRRGSRVANR